MVVTESMIEDGSFSAIADNVSLHTVVEDNPWAFHLAQQMVMRQRIVKSISY